MNEAKLDALAEYVRYLRERIVMGAHPEALEDWVVRIYGCAWAEVGSV